MPVSAEDDAGRPERVHSVPSVTRERLLDRAARSRRQRARSGRTAKARRAGRTRAAMARWRRSDRRTALPTVADQLGARCRARHVCVHLGPGADAGPQDVPLDVHSARPIGLMRLDVVQLHRGRPDERGRREVLSAEARGRINQWTLSPLRSSASAISSTLAKNGFPRATTTEPCACPTSSAFDEDRT